MISKFTSTLKAAFAAVLILIAAQSVKAQVVKTEGFENTAAVAPTFPTGELPFGWTYGFIAPSNDANNAWDRVDVANAVFPTTGAAHGGTKMIRYRSYYMINAVNNPEKGYICSRPYDLSARGAATASNIHFWLYRDNVYAYNDQVTVQVNNSPTVAGASAVLNEMTTFSGAGIPRNAGQFPAGTANAWNQYTFQIPAGAVWSTNTLYVLITVTHTGAGAGGGNVYIDDFDIDTYPTAQSFGGAAAIGMDQQFIAPVAKPSANNPIIGIHVTATNEGAPPCALTAFTFTHNGSTNPSNDIVAGSAKLWWTGGTNAFSLTNAIQVGNYAGGFPVVSYAINPAVPGGLLNGINYFWLTYDISAAATANDFVDADFISANVCGAATTCGGVGCALAGARPIDVAYCVPSYTAGTSWLNGSYTANDYVRHVICPGDPLYPPGIDNDHNDIPAGVLPAGAGWGGGSGSNWDPCVSSSTQLSAGAGTIPSPFMTHPPEYQKFPIASVPNMCSGGNSSRTAVFLADGTASYNINVQCGTWYGANCIAAWIDFNHDGVFNNTLVPAAGGEKLFQSGYMNALTWVAGAPWPAALSFAVPDGAVTGYWGTTTMRVREWYANNNMDACNPGYYGEIEDYTVTLRPGCSPLYPGWKIWLGYTDDWNVNSNWCGGVPTINDNALIPGFGAQPFNRNPVGTYHPVIKTGVNATTKKLVILNDTVEINAPVPNALGLQVSDSLSIGTFFNQNQSLLKVDSTYRDSAQLSNGVSILTGTNLIFRGGQREKIQLMYKNTELSGKGMIDGDLIDSIYIPIRTRNSNNPWKNVNISYYYGANGAYFNVNTGYTGIANNTSVAPQNFGLPSNAIYANASLLLSGAPWNIPAAGGWVKVPLTTPIQVNVSNGAPLIITICFDQMGAANATPLGDYTWQTQTVGYRSMMQLYQLGTNAPSVITGCGMMDTTGYTISNSQGQGFQRAASDFRPNLTFKFHRVYKEFPIELKTNGPTTGTWANWGNFVPANSLVTFDGTTLIQQNIDGSNNTTFDGLKINNGFNVRQNKAATVNDTLWLTAGSLILNGPNTAPMTLTLNNTTLGAITRTGGFLQSENIAPNYGLVDWKMGGTLGNHVFPFISNNGPTYIPFTYNATGGTSDLTIGTYYPSTTPASLLPLPTGVTTINSYNNPAVTDAPNLVRRFWTMNNTGVAPVANLNFTWSGTIQEQPGAGLGTYNAQRWDNTTNPIPGYLSVGPGWWPPMAGGPGVSVPVAGVNNFNIAWVLGLQAQPLPVTLLNFTAKPEKDKVRLDWATASETNCDKFVVERTTNTSDFNFINEQKSKGPSTNTLNYYTYDYSPKIGKQFYRLTEKDYNGADTYSKLVPVFFGTSANAFEITKTANKEDGSFEVEFNYNSDLPCSYKIVDMLGNIVYAQKDFKAENGLNTINIKTHLASGVYSIMIQNQEETVARKIFRQ